MLEREEQLVLEHFRAGVVRKVKLARACVCLGQRLVVGLDAKELEFDAVVTQSAERQRVQRRAPAEQPKPPPLVEDSDGEGPPGLVEDSDSEADAIEPRRRKRRSEPRRKRRKLRRASSPGQWPEAETTGLMWALSDAGVGTPPAGFDAAMLNTSKAQVFTYYRCAKYKGSTCTFHSA